MKIENFEGFVDGIAAVALEMIISGEAIDILDMVIFEGDVALQNLGSWFHSNFMR